MDRIPVICGPTGSGKSDAVYASIDDNFEIISADAFQIYKRLDIGTAKPSKEIIAKNKHHQIDMVEPDGSYTTGDYVRDTELIIADILERGKKPVIVGGTALYIQSLRDGMFDIPDGEPAYRGELQQIAIEKGSAYLHEQLTVVDPVAGARIHPNDLVRIIRGLEVFKTTGYPISQAHIHFQKPAAYKYKIMILDRNRDELYNRINKRVDRMIDEGWIDEVKKLLDSGYNESMPSFRAIGYRELTDLIRYSGPLDGSKNPLSDTVELIAQKTRNYAKRQLTWYRNMDDADFATENTISTFLKNI